MGEAKRRFESWQEIEGVDMSKPAGPGGQIIPNQTSGDDLLLRRITLGEVFEMSDGTRYIFDRYGTVHRLHVRESGRKE